jgi:predicted small lipoprotein YifL
LGVHLIHGSRLALVGVALLALALGGCGRKSKLDSPPQASIQPAPGQQPDGRMQEPQRGNPLGLFDADEDEKPVAAPGQKRRIILDPILD